MENPFIGSGKADIARRLHPSADDDTVQDYVEDAWAKAVAVAPMIAEDSWPLKPEKVAQVKAILRGIILRWHEAQAGGVTGRTQTAGPFAQTVQLDTRPKRGYSLMPSDVVDLQRVTMRKGQPFSISTIPDDTSPPKTFANGPHPHESSGGVWV